MLNKKKYLIRTHKLSSTVQNDEKIVEFEFSDLEGKPSTIAFESQIGNFFEYDKQLLKQLEGINLKARLWNKNIIYFSIPNNLDVVQMRCFFDAADQVNAIESYLLKENIAILLTSEFKDVKSQNCLLIGLFKTKLELSVIENLEFKYLKTFYIDEELMSEIPDLTNIIEKYLSLIKNKFRIHQYYLISSEEHIKLKSLNKFKRIKNHETLILEGLRIASNNDVPQLYNRLKL